MPRYQFCQTQKHSCGAAALMVAIAELRSLGQAWLTQKTETKIYKRIWQAKGDDSNIAKIAQYTRRKFECEAKVHENLFVTAALRKDQAFQLEHSLFDLDMKAVGEASETTRGMVADMFDKDARALLVFAYKNSRAGYNLHFLLARKEDEQVWLMNPDGGLDHRAPKFSEWISRPWHKYTGMNKVEYIFTGIYVVPR